MLNRLPLFYLWWLVADSWIAVCFTHSKGRRTYTSGTVNSFPLLKVGRKSIYFPSHFSWFVVPKLHRFAPIFSKSLPRVTPPDPKTTQTSPQSPSTSDHHPTFSEFPWPPRQFMARLIIRSKVRNLVTGRCKWHWVFCGYVFCSTKPCCCFSCESRCGMFWMWNDQSCCETICGLLTHVLLTQIVWDSGDTNCDV